MVTKHITLIPICITKIRTSTKDFEKFNIELLSEDEIEVTQQNVEKIDAIGKKISNEAYNFFEKDKTPFETCQIHSKIFVKSI